MKHIFVIINLLIFFPPCFCYSQPATIENEIRSRESFNEDWRFSRFGTARENPEVSIPEPEGLYKAEIDDSHWRTLHLPHDWGIEGPFNNNLENATALLPWRGIGWYRKHFKISDSERGRQVYIDFDGAMANAQVWLNGKYLGQWPYGYTSFRFDLTPHLKYGEDNIIAVRLDTEDLDSRWYPGAGIYRNVWLVKTKSVHIGHWGVFVTTPEIESNSGKVELRIDINNRSKTARSVEVWADLFESGNNPKKVASTKPVNIDIATNKPFCIRQEAAIENPKLWDIEHPNLYKAVIWVKSNEEIVDKYETTFGFRTLKFTARDGFYLNGKRTQIKGVCNHHDLGPLGTAFNVSAAKRQLQLLKEMGCNAIRTSHNPPAPELVQLCDEMGFLIQIEAFDAWRKAKREKDYNLLFDGWHVEDLMAMVRRDRNSPSVFMWSIGNEVPDQNNPPLAEALAAIVRSEDPTRPVTSGVNSTVAAFNGFQHASDVFGFNYNHLNYARYFNFEENDSLPMYASETSSCVSSRGEYFFPVIDANSNEQLAGKGIFQISSYDVLHPWWGYAPDVQFELLEKYPAVLGEFVWTGFDYLGEPSPFNNDKTNLLNFSDPEKRKEIQDWLDKIGTEEIPSRSSYFGILDLCGFKKDRFYSYQAQWRPELPMAHIFPHWNWPERAGKITPVHVYTSGDEAELFLNGKSLGKKKKGEYEYRLRWDDVLYEPGTLKVVAYKNGKLWAGDIMKTTEEAYKIGLEANKDVINAANNEYVFITVKVEDKNGLMVPRSHNLIQFEVVGEGEIVAIGNGNAASHESFQNKYHSVFNGMCLVILKAKSTETGKMKLIARSEKLKSGEKEISIN